VAVRAIITDVGGVLLLREEVAAHRAWEERLGFERGGFMRALFWPELSARATIGEVSAAHVWDEMATRLSLSVADVQELRRDFFAGERLNEAFADYLRGMRPMYRTAIVSNAWSGTRQAISAHYGVDRLVDLMIFSDEEGIAKPDPRIYQLAAERLGLASEEAIFLDDVPRNVEGAQAVGMIGIHFRDTAQAIAAIEKHLSR
jgi:epoxide hydrolase-like predicted phosphatase